MEELSILPEAFRSRAVILAGEEAWPKDAAQSVIEFLSQNNFAVLGIELWIPEGDVPRVVGWSEYDIPFSGDWNEYVQLNAQHALHDLDRSACEECLFSLTWISEVDYRKMIARRAIKPA
jgi:hypothetical protein